MIFNDIAPGSFIRPAEAGGLVSQKGREGVQPCFRYSRAASQYGPTVSQNPLPAKPAGGFAPRLLEDLVDDAVLLRLVCGHKEVAVDVLLDLIERLPGGLCQNLVQAVAGGEDMPGRDLDIGCLALHAAPRLGLQTPLTLHGS